MQRRKTNAQTNVLTCAEESILAVESLIAVGALGSLARADWCEYMTINRLLVLLFALLLFILFVFVLFLHR